MTQVNVKSGEMVISRWTGGVVATLITATMLGVVSQLYGMTLAQERTSTILERVQSDVEDLRAYTGRRYTQDDADRDWQSQNQLNALLQRQIDNLEERVRKIEIGRAGGK